MSSQGGSCLCWVLSGGPQRNPRPQQLSRPPVKSPTSHLCRWELFIWICNFRRLCSSGETREPLGQEGFGQSPRRGSRSAGVAEGMPLDFVTFLLKRCKASNRKPLSPTEMQPAVGVEGKDSGGRGQGSRPRSKILEKEGARVF